MKEKQYVYELLDPTRNNGIFYVGITKRPTRRLRAHISLKDMSNPLKRSRIKFILNNNLKPQMKIIYECENRNEAKKIEIKTIKKYGKIIDGTGILTNYTNGGDGICIDFETHSKHLKIMCKDNRYKYMGIQQNNTTGYRGVCHYPKHGSNHQWKAQIYTKLNNKKKMIFLGYFATPEEAALAYNQKSKKIHGEYAYQNTLK